jgi:putative heme iron utilization protein
LSEAAWEARKLLRSARQATLATQAGGQPFASLVTPAVAPDGALLMLLSSLSEHTRHLAADGRCALLVTGVARDANPQTAPRLTLSGTAEPWLDASAKAYWVARHPYAAFYADFTDFSLWRLRPEAGFYVGGFAKAARLCAASLAPPPEAVAALQAAEPQILIRCNTDQRAAFCKLAGVGDWTMLGVDCDGFDLVQGNVVLRFAFPSPVFDVSGARLALGELIKEALLF